MAEPESTASRAEKYIWQNMQRQLESKGQGAAGVQLQHHLRATLRNVAEQAGGLRTYHFDMQHRVSDYSVTLNAQDGELMGWQFSLLGDDTQGQGEVAAEYATMAAREAAQPPPNAVLSTAEFETVGDRRVFLARWIHQERGVLIERDYIQVLVNSKSGRAFSFSRKWHKINPEFSLR